MGIAASHSICMPSRISDPAALIGRDLSCCAQAKAPLVHPLRQSRRRSDLYSSESLVENIDLHPGILPHGFGWIAAAGL
jgi:hypothetical protein